MEDGDYQICTPETGGDTTIVARGATRVAAVDAALAGLVAIATGQDTPRDDATLAIPLRADRPDLPSLVQALAAQITDEAVEHAAPVTAIRLDGLRRTDDGFTAWGYAYVTPGAGAPPALPTIAEVTATEEGGEMTVILTLLPASSELIP